MAGRYKDIPPNIQKRIEALYGISFEEWGFLKIIIDRSFDKKREQAEKGFKIDSQEDIENTIFHKY